MDYSISVCEKKKEAKERKKERKTYINFKFSGESKELEKLRNQKKAVPVN